MAKKNPKAQIATVATIHVNRGEQFLALAQGIVDGFVGLLRYLAFIATAEIALAELSRAEYEQINWEKSARSPEDHFFDESRADFENLSRRLVLVHSITLVDAFISDITTLLVVTYPEVVAQDVEMKLSDLIALDSIDDAVNKLIKLKIRSISNGSIRKRVQFIRKSFGLHIEISEAKYRSLEKYIAIRNAAIHNWGPYEIAWTRCGPVLEGVFGSGTKFNVTDEVPHEALSLLMRMAASVVDGTATAFSLGDDPRLRKIVSWLDEGGIRRSKVATE